jgi:tRNA threonylcarbamoyladenosine dehydratase
MIEDWQERTLLLLKADKVNKLNMSNVLVVGLGGVGAYAAEMLCRAGIGKMTIVDFDTVNPSNKNRQLLALDSTIGKSKSEIMANRLLDINPNLDLTVHIQYFKDEFIDNILEEPFDYVVDAIDTVSPKIFFINQAIKNGLKLVSSMGAGGRLDPSKIHVADFSKSYNCNLAKILRKKLRKLGVKNGFKVVFSTEFADDESTVLVENVENKKTAIGTISYMPAIFGCLCASVVIRELISPES